MAQPPEPAAGRHDGRFPGEAGGHRLGYPAPGLLLEPAAERGDVGQQPPGLVLLHVEAGTGEQHPPVVAGLDDVRSEPFTFDGTSRFR